MSYMSGIMMGFAIGKGIRQFFASRKGVAGENMMDYASKAASAVSTVKKVADVPSFSLASRMKGRRRYYAAALVGNGDLADLLAKKLGELKFIDEVTISTVTGSLLIMHHGSEQMMDALADWLAEHIFTPSSSPSAVSEGLAAVGMSIRRTVSDLNTRVKKATGSIFDLSSLLAVFFIFNGVKKLLIAPSLPSGSQLMWWAFSLLRGWRLV
ncbi:MAG: HMA2 domain-containing protein [Selenomonadaceae bacterium]